MILEYICGKPEIFKVLHLGTSQGWTWCKKWLVKISVSQLCGKRALAFWKKLSDFIAKLSFGKWCFMHRRQKLTSGLGCWSKNREFPLHLWYIRLVSGGTRVTSPLGWHDHKGPLLWFPPAWRGGWHHSSGPQHQLAAEETEGQVWVLSAFSCAWGFNEILLIEVPRRTCIWNTYTAQAKTC